MGTINATNHVFEKVQVFGRSMLYTGDRINRKTVPKGMCHYELRHDDRFRIPCSIEMHVSTNYFGALLTPVPFNFAGKSNIPLAYEDFVYGGDKLTIKEFINQYGSHQAAS